MNSLIRTHIGTERVKVAAEKIDEVLALQTERAAAAIELPMEKNVGMAVEFRDVTFHYRRGFGIENLSFRIEKGEFVGIVGPTGGGKSTIMDLLMGFYVPESGKILVDEADISEVSLPSLRRCIGMVPQEVFLWNTTIRENIIYPNDDVDTRSLLRVIHLTKLDELVEKQPDGLDTVVGENGLALAGGERQRLAIARAIIKEPRILLMDEGTSALDALTEARIRDLIDRAGNGRTKIVIAHRLATVLHADRILVIDDGRIVEAGTVPVLLRQRGLFFKLFQAQSLEIRGQREVAEWRAASA